jgi:putative membrane protein
MLMVIGSRQFESASQCSAYLGLVPVRHELGSSIKGRSRLSKAGNPVSQRRSIFSVLIWSGVNPKDYLTWLLETVPAMVAFIVLMTTHQRFPLTSLAYGLILVLSLILMIGGHYTYAEVPLFDWFKDVFNLDRNNFDKVAHFAQGFVPAIIAREIIIRNDVVKNTNWLNFFVSSICLAISAFYELIEWCVAIVSKEAAEAFLGTQGYIWDTQSDMAFALLGAMVALATLNHVHDRQISKLMDKK